VENRHVKYGFSWVVPLKVTAYKTTVYS